MLSIHTILHPTDFSAQSEHAFQLACDLAADYDANLVIVHVVAAPIMFGDGAILPPTYDCRDELQDKLLGLEVPDDRVGVVRRLEEGNPATEILQVAHVCQADLIVMGTHGRRGLTRLLMGSVAEEIVRQATCPVLTVSTPMPNQESRVRRHESVISS